MQWVKYMNSAIFCYIHVYISWRKQLNFQWDDDEVRFVLDQLALLDFYSASSLKQQSADRHVAPLGHIILIPYQLVFALSPSCCIIIGEATNTNFTVFGFTRSGLEPTIYRTWGEHIWKIYDLIIWELKMLTHLSDTSRSVIRGGFRGGVRGVHPP